MKQLAPLGKYLLIEPIKEEDQKSESGLIVPDIAKEKPQRGNIIAIGQDTVYEYTESTVVLFKQWGGYEVKENNKQYLIIHEDDVLGVYIGE